MPRTPGTHLGGRGGVACGSLLGALLVGIGSSVVAAQDGATDYPQWRGRARDGSASAFVAPAATLLDVGAGRGWPGSHVARTSGCRLVSTDVPWDALLTAKTRPGIEVVAAQGGALPFRGDTFDAIVHADVFC